MKINLNLIINIYKKTSFILGVLSILSFILLLFLYNMDAGFSFSIGSFLILLNIVGIILIAKFSSDNGNIEKEKVVISIALFVGKLFLLLVVIFLLIYFKLVNDKLFLGGLSLGFLIFFIANLIFIPIEIYKIEKIKE